MFFLKAAWLSVCGWLIWFSICGGNRSWCSTCDGGMLVGCLWHLLLFLVWVLSQFLYGVSLVAMKSSSCVHLSLLFLWSLSRIIPSNLGKEESHLVAWVCALYLVLPGRFIWVIHLIHDMVRVALAMAAVIVVQSSNSSSASSWMVVSMFFGEK